ncbi:MAG: LacI family transcriptional regulator [Bacteroidetes bacterium]|nr:MAG: LacI family transcriptional regulator [Bacteroidota bacterium]
MGHREGGIFRISLRFGPESGRRRAQKARLVASPAWSVVAIPTSRTSFPAFRLFRRKKSCIFQLYVTCYEKPAMRKKRVSITDMARELKVSPSTVSRALRGEPRIGKATREAVLALAKEWGYRPNMQALSLLNNRTQTVGLIVPDFAHPFFSVVLNGIEDVTREAGYQLMICTSDSQYEKEVQVASLLGDARVDGLLVSYARDTQEFSHFQRLQAEGVPVVFFDRLAEDVEASYVITDDFEGARQAVKHLIDTGCRRIVHVKGPEHISTTFNRYLGYREALKQAGIPLDPELLFQAEDDKGQDLLDMDRLRDLLPNIDGLFVFNDLIAYELIGIIRGVGLRVPEDISIIGFGNDPFGVYLTPSLSTVHQPAREMGQTAARVLLSEMQAEHVPPTRSELLPTRLLLRGTTRPRG